MKQETLFVSGKIWRSVAYFFLLAMFSVWVSAAPLILTSPPRESEKAGKALYQPLAEHLSKVLGRPVIYEHPDNWLKYQREMRNDAYDVVFDGPHFAAWRMVHLGHRMVVKLPVQLQFHLVTQADNDKILQLNDLVGKRICGISPPNLSTLTILARYENPVRQPQIRGIRGGMNKVFKAFQQGKCKAAVLRTTYYKRKLSDADRSKLKIIYSSPSLPGQVISVSKRISDSDLEQIQHSLLTSDAGHIAVQAILKRFGGKQARAFIKASDEEYEGDNKYLEGVIFGW